MERLKTLEPPEMHTIVESWLSSIDAPDDSVEVSGWKAASAPASASSAPPSLRGRSTTPPDGHLHHHHHHHPYRGRKRKRTMSEPSKGPSTHRSSSYPIRSLWTLLAAATPAVHYKQHFETILPEYVSKLKKNLLQARERGVIPEQLKASILKR